MTPSERDQPVPRTRADAGVLYLIATPIGNLEDLSVRAIALIRTVDLLLAEDTRRTRKLLSHFGVRRSLQSYHEHNERRQTSRVVGRLQQGASVGLVSDAGTPAISDPGTRLVRAAIRAGVRVVPVPGPSAPIAALVASGLPADRFTFAGYPPRRPTARRRFLSELVSRQATLLLLEAPHRIVATLETIQEVAGPHRQVVLAREMTKAHEQFLRGEVGDLLERVREHPPRGEITLCVAPSQGEPQPQDQDPAELRDRYRSLLASGCDRREALQQLRRATGLRRNDLYRLLLNDTGDTP